MECKRIYDVVRASGLPNALSARVPLPSKLNVRAWEFYLNQLEDKQNVLDFIIYGFPMGYAGPVSDTVGVDNHPSATKFPVHVSEFIDKEKGLDGVIGPYDHPPFAPWCHVSPLMTREKGDPDKRRIITDMTFPLESSINAYIVKNGVYGCQNEHSLPTVDALARDIAEVGPGVFLATVDISRAYKNFMSDPLDWPLLCFKWDDNFFCDLSMPFGARASSFHMQSVANCITDILRGEGIHCYMYLDDLVIMSPNRQDAHRQYDRARQLIRELGLPEAVEKAQPPSTSIKWLGIIINTERMSLSIPTSKVKDILEQVRQVYHKSYISKRKLQSLLGHLLFIAKCVRPARIFVSRLLTALRQAKSGSVRVGPDIRKDLDWFLQFCEVWNGTSLIPPPSPGKVILVDACLSGIGATDGKCAYGVQTNPPLCPARNITEMEAANVVVALHTFLGEADRGSHVRVRCDNQAAVSVFTSGAAHNPVLQDCARAAWMVQALLDVHLTYDHIPGVDNDVADALSRAHLSRDKYTSATSFVTYYHLSCVAPCLHYVDLIKADLFRRPTSSEPTRTSGAETGQRAGSGHPRQPQSDRGGVHRLYEAHVDRPTAPAIPARLCIHGVRGTVCEGPCDHTQQAFTRTDVPAAGGGRHYTDRPSPRTQGNGRLHAGQNIRTQGQGPHSHAGHEEGPTGSSQHHQRRDSASRSVNNVLWRPTTIGGYPPSPPGIRPSAPPDTGRHLHDNRWCNATYKVGKEHAKGGAIPNGKTPTYGGQIDLPSYSNTAKHHGGPHQIQGGPPIDVPRLQAPSAYHLCKESMGKRPTAGRDNQPQVLTAQPQEGSRHPGPCKGVPRDRDTTSRWLALRGIQNLYRHPNWQSHRRPQRLNI